MDISCWFSVCGDRSSFPPTPTILEAKDMAEIFQVEIFEKYRKSGESVFLSLHCSVGSALFR